MAAGGIGLVPGQDVHARTAHIGYWLGEPCWGRGIMTAAVRRLSGHAMRRRMWKDGQLTDCMLYAKVKD